MDRIRAELENLLPNDRHEIRRRLDITEPPTMDDLTAAIMQMHAKGITVVLMPDPEDKRLLRVESFLLIDPERKLHDAIRINARDVLAGHLGGFIAHNLAILERRIDNALAGKAADA